MGCKHTQIEHNGELFNEDVDIRKRFLTGVHIAKGADGVHGNIQIALGVTRRKKYERVAPAMPTIVEEEEPPAVED